MRSRLTSLVKQSFFSNPKASVSSINIRTSITDNNISTFQMCVEKELKYCDPRSFDRQIHRNQISALINSGKDEHNYAIRTEMLNVLENILSGHSSQVTPSTKEQTTTPSYSLPTTGC